METTITLVPTPNFACFFTVVLLRRAIRQRVDSSTVTKVVLPASRAIHTAPLGQPVPVHPPSPPWCLRVPLETASRHFLRGVSLAETVFRYPPALDSPIPLPEYLPHPA